MSKKITIIGDGAMATVSALLLENKGYSVTIWGAFADYTAEMIQTRENSRYLPGYKLPDAIKLTSESDRAFRDVDFVINAVPTQYVRTVWSRLADALPAGLPIASLSKGIETDTLLRPTQIITDVLSPLGKQERSLACISGPSVADELAKCLPATVCAASDDADFAKELQETFNTHWFRVYTNSDLLGVELAGATKNVIALAAGMLDGLQAGINAKSALLSRGLAEITRLGLAMGASQETFFGISGVGDLATTCFSPTGRNRTCGEQLGRGRKLDDVLDAIPGIVEGVPTTKSVLQLSEKFKIEMPITEALNMVLFQGLDPLEGISKLMSRGLKAEQIR
ncbi:Glycerol-3-phosphate dehydrogenase [NAD(P)+] [Poriferisphaera corsica]|uniref:Glycerol-3-phosphate dehydrogenase [NAD(P)+] n=1 Tax=Poriferisphaera corsica TaxID=2528020 RepID=A0A517YXK5_9BACT|nr:NAD(P)H-dependent glycerol-3-phosphate dehydrogenase [Poriferisphaera corsica]QDU34950.1 Glycerol-3-phosphate dehydrogenase [NAD(P)+] [Poriferisphaera corsica]